MSPFADNVGREIRSFAFNPSPITRMFASPADYVREPIHVAGLDDGLHPSTAQKNINLGILETVIIPLPPVREIRRIVAKVDQMMAFCDELEAKIEANQNTAEHFAEAVVVDLAD